MAALVAGNTLTDLSRNSLIEDATRQGAYENAMNRARRAYEYNNLSAQDRERTNQLMADLAMRRELGLGDIGVRREAIGAQRDVGMADVGVRNRGVDVQERLGLGDLAYKNQLLGVEKELRGRGLDIEADRVKAQREGIGAQRDVNMAQIGANMVTARYPWDLGMTPAQEAQNRINQTSLSNQLAIGTLPYIRPTAAEALNYDILAQQWKLGGPRQIELAQAAALATNQANSILESNREQAFNKLVSDIKPWYGGLDDAAVTARSIQDAIDKGGDPYSIQGLSRSQREAAVNYKNAINAARGSIATDLADRYGTINYDSTSGRFVPLYRVGGQTSERTQQLSPSGKPDITIERDSGGVVRMYRNLPDGSREPSTIEKTAPAPQATQPVQTQQPGFFGNMRRASQSFWGTAPGVAKNALTPPEYGLVRGIASRVLPSFEDVQAVILGPRRNYMLKSEATLPPVEPPQYQTPVPQFGLPPVEPVGY